MIKAFRITLIASLLVSQTSLFGFDGRGIGNELNKLALLGGITCTVLGVVIGLSLANTGNQCTDTVETAQANEPNTVSQLETSTSQVNVKAPKLVHLK